MKNDLQTMSQEEYMVQRNSITELYNLGQVSHRFGSFLISFLNARSGLNLAVYQAKEGNVSAAYEALENSRECINSAMMNYVSDTDFWNPLLNHAMSFHTNVRNELERIFISQNKLGDLSA